MNYALNESRFKLVSGYNLQNKAKIAVEPLSHWGNRKMTWFILSLFGLVYIWTCGKNFRSEAILLSFLLLTPLWFVIFVFGNLFCKQNVLQRPTVVSPMQTGHRNALHLKTHAGAWLRLWHSGLQSVTLHKATPCKHSKWKISHTVTIIFEGAYVWVS